MKILPLLTALLLFFYAIPGCAQSLGGPARITRTIIQDQQGDLWMAAFDGIYRYDAQGFDHVTKDVSAGRFFGILESRNGGFWMSTIGEGVYYYDGATFTQYTTADGLASDRVPHVYQDKIGNIWFGTEEGLSVYEGKAFRSFTTADGLPHNDVNAIVEDKQGRYWIGTRGAACLFDGQRFTSLPLAFDRVLTNVRDIMQDSQGNIWLGGNEGLWRYDGTQAQRISDSFTGNLFEDQRGQIWVTAESKSKGGWALICYPEAASGQFLLSKEYLSQQAMLFGIGEDLSGTIWVGTLNGVLSLRP